MITAHLSEEDRKDCPRIFWSPEPKAEGDQRERKVINAHPAAITLECTRANYRSLAKFQASDCRGSNSPWPTC